MRGYLLAGWLMLSSCSSSEQPPPPYDVYFCDGTPAEDIALWLDAVDEWETMVGAELFIDHAESRPDGECGITICAADLSGNKRATYYPSEGCTPSIVYESDTLFVTRQHELGHALGLDHEGEGTMRQGDASSNVVTLADAQRVRRRWGLEAPEMPVLWTARVP
jgi:hypothetical protein